MAPVARMAEIGLPRSASERRYKPAELHYRPSAVGGDDYGRFQVSLHQKRSSIGQYQTTCISRHYALNDKILQGFEAHLEQHLYSVAFHLGLTFVETALLEIPKHGYFYSEKFADLRTKSSHDALRVTSQLQQLLELEPDKLGKEYAKLDLLQFLATEQCERLSSYEAHRLKVQTELSLMARKEKIREQMRQSSSNNTFRAKSHNGSNTTSVSSSFSDCDVGSTLLACGESISSVFCPTLTMPTSNTKLYPPIPSSSPNHHQQQGTIAALPYPDPMPRSRTAPSKIFPPTSVGNATKEYADLYPPSPKPTVVNQTSLMDEDDEEDDIEPSIDTNIFITEDSAYMDGSRTRLDPQSTVYLEEDNKLPPSYNDIFKLYDDNKGNDHREVISSLPPSSRNDTTGNQHHLRRQSSIDLERALYLSGLEVMTDSRQQGRAGVMVSSDNEKDGSDSTGGDELRDDVLPVYYHGDSGMADSFFSDESSTIPTPAGATRRQTSTGISVEMLRGCYHEDFDALRTIGRIVITQIPTYQGRVIGSTNGCTVIAPLMCIHHFHNDEIDVKSKKVDFVPDPELSDQILVEVIDEETPNILPTVRKNLGLQQDAFLIPSDAHESLMDQQYMCPEQFLNVCGGNILAEEHLELLLDQLCKVGTKKIGVTLFFHEHVIAILQLRRSPKTVWFDIIDSLPHRGTLRRKGEKDEDDQLASLSSGGSVFGSQQVVHGSKFSGNSSSGILSDDEWGDVDDTEMQMQQLMVDAIPSQQNAARIRCMDRDALKAALRWYACNAFTPENASYIDNYEWNENLPDFDPRVFQAFIWQEP